MFQIKGNEAEITGEICNEHGIKILEFSQPIGPFFHYEPPTNETFGDQPHLQDPLEKKYVYLKHSNLFPEAGEGIFASRNVPANTVYAQYNGMLYNSKEHRILMDMKSKLISDKKYYEISQYR